MVDCISGGAPNAGYTELTASALAIIGWAVDFSPSMTAATFYSPAMLFGILQCLFNLFIWVFIALHGNIVGYSSCEQPSCQMTTGLYGVFPLM
jgi:hypothetical protein